MVDFADPAGAREYVTSTELDRRISHAEQRLKYWIVSGIVANCLIIAGAAVSLAYSAGEMASSLQESISAATIHERTLRERGIWMQERIIWEDSVETFLESKGYVRPRMLPPRSYRPSEFKVE